MKFRFYSGNLLIVFFLTIMLYSSCRNESPNAIGETDLSGSDGIFEFREEARSGVSAETGLLKSWPEEGPPLIWIARDIPPGYSSVSFGNNTIYLTGQVGEDDALIAIDNRGKIKWQTPYGRVWKASFPESRCTPTVDGSKVYVSSGNGDLACIDGLSGEIIWSQKTREEYKGTTGPWGIAESPLIDGQKLYFTTGGPETTTIALDKNTGGLIWKSESIDDGASYVSPILIESEGKKILVNISLTNIFAVDVSDGKILWKINHNTTINPGKSDGPKIKCVSPLYHDGGIYLTGGYNHGGAMLNLADSGKKVSVAWTDDVLDVHHGGIVLIDGYIYGSNWINNKDGNWCCIDWNTGKKMYEEKWKCKGSIISAEGNLYIYEEKSGFVGLVRPDPMKFDLLSSFRIKEGSGPHWAHPVIFNKVLYIRHGNALMAYNINGESGTMDKTIKTE